VLTLQQDGISTRAADATSLLAGSAWAPGQGNYYGVRLRGTITAPITGDYTFFISGDDSAELYLSADRSRFNKQRIAWLYQWSNAQQWDKFFTQRSEIIHLTTGETYYIEAQMFPALPPTTNTTT